ncbi:hypothetical protein OQA88_12711 [Cercophora sp. LCS_1]
MASIIRPSDIIRLRLDRFGAWTKSRLEDIPQDTEDPGPDIVAILYLLEGVDHRIIKFASWVGICQDEPSRSSFRTFLQRLKDDKRLSTLDRALASSRASMAPVRSHNTGQQCLTRLHRRVKQGVEEMRIKEKALAVAAQKSAFKASEWTWARRGEFVKHALHPVRRLAPLSESPDGSTHAIRETVFFWCGQRKSHMIGTIVFDPPRTILAKTWSLVRADHSLKSVPPLRSTFLSEFHALQVDADARFLDCHRIITLFAIEEESKVQDTLGEELDSINLSLVHGGDITTRRSSKSHLHFGGWKNVLLHQSRTLKILHREAKQLDSASESTKSRVSTIESLPEENQVLTQRLEGTFQTLVSNLQILAGEKAIEETVTSLYVFSQKPLTF